MENDRKEITMKDIAAHFGVSTATVSRALSDNPSISLQRRQAIQAFAREHDFVPNPLGRQLRHIHQRPSRLIGVILPQMVHYYFSTVLSGIEETASERGYQIICAQSNEDPEREKQICQNFHGNRVCGVIVSQAKRTTTYDHFHLLQDSGIPLVFYDRISTGIEASRVVVDDYNGAFEAVCHLAKCGYQRIAFYGSPMNMEISKNRFNGYKDALFHSKLVSYPELVFNCDDRETALDLTPLVMRCPNPPDAFFCVNDDTAIGTLHALKRMGIDVPSQIGICGFTNGERAIACDPMLTTVEQRGHRLGQEAANILIDQAEGILPKNKVQRRIIRTKLIVRGTTK